ncbi:MAG: hypothetical protein C9356_01190 [Oleiphilus sp.]|nr:MAG: hypothetical protein C9356_01190 [Oleiphilus sp.]
MEQHILLARQAIYRKDLSLHGFELLFRSQEQLNALEVGEDNATFEVLVNYSTGISQEIDSSRHPLFVNVSQSFLQSDVILSMDRHRVVLELLERIDVTDALVANVARLHKAGYRFALDDYDFDPRWTPLIPFADIIKVDVLEANLEEIGHAKAAVTGFEGDWLAERIEDQDTLHTCIDMGFTLFQGYVLAKPKEVLGNKIQGSTAVTTEIIRLSSDPEVELEMIANQVARDPKLSMQLLKLINSPLVNLNREVSDLKQAISYLGID